MSFMQLLKCQSKSKCRTSFPLKSSLPLNPLGANSIIALEVGLNFKDRELVNI